MENVAQRSKDRAADPQSDEKPSSTKFLPPTRPQRRSKGLFSFDASTCLPDPASGREDLEAGEVESDHGEGPEDDVARRPLPMTTGDDVYTKCAYDVFGGELDEDAALHDRLEGLQRHRGNPGYISDVPGARPEDVLEIVSGHSGQVGANLSEDTLATQKDIWPKQGKYIKRLPRVFGEGSR
mmetsp:Transcript_124313/g.398038  ORF Transcript_124313/g.398038 Transcript_124313/m.398038 type:complete len:182 (-) Transcript_124313:152-697(-)